MEGGSWHPPFYGGKESCEYADADRGHTARGRERGQGNFELAANSDYDSRGSADPRESLRRRRISKLALNATYRTCHWQLPPDAMQHSVAPHRLPATGAVFLYLLNFLIS